MDPDYTIEDHILFSKFEIWLMSDTILTKVVSVILMLCYEG